MFNVGMPELVVILVVALIVLGPKRLPEVARTLGKAMNGDKANKQATLRIHPEVAKALRSSERDVLNEIEEYLGPVDINSDPAVHQEQFDFAFI